jgi:hypothetical protein
MDDGKLPINILVNFTIKDFIIYMLSKNDVFDILSSIILTPTENKSVKINSIRGSVFERICDICVKFGFCDKFKNSEYHHIIGNVNNAKVEILGDFRNYLKGNVISGNSSGCSDITLQNKNDHSYVFSTCKYFESSDEKKQRSVKDYDVQNIVSMIDNNKSIYQNSKIYLIVRDKYEVLDKVQRSRKSSDYMTKHITEDNIIDIHDINRYFLEFKQDIFKNYNNDNNNWSELYLGEKERLTLRFHQRLITQKTSDLIEKGNKSFLWACKPRSGKTYCCASLILKEYEKKKKLNVLILTPVPAETLPQFTNDLFIKFRDFNNFNIEVLGGKKIDIDYSKNYDNNIIIASKQCMQKYVDVKTLTNIKNLNFDLIFADENHYASTTDLAKSIFDSYVSKNTVKIYMTATYNKPLKEWNVLPECQMYWDIDDEQICKSILSEEKGVDRLKEKHGSEIVTNVIKHYIDLGQSLNDIFKCYGKMPDMYLITNMFDSQRYQIIKAKLNNNNKIGFCFDTLFALNKKKTRFYFENEVKTMLRYVSGSHKEEDGEKTIFPRIFYTCSEMETRLPFTQIWFLPPNNINELSECLKTLMEQDLILKKYDILCINRKNGDLIKDVKIDIRKAEETAKSNGRRGLILLAGNMLTLGITLDLCDLVVLMNNTLSSDKVLQQMYRCMTEADNKKMGFVVDLNISRVLHTCINYATRRNDKSIDDKIQYLINYHLINIDIDMMLNKKIDETVIIKKLIDIWREDPINAFNSLIRRLDNDYEEFDNTTQKLINSIFSKSSKYNKINLCVVMKDGGDEIQDFPSGKERIENKDVENKDVENKDVENKDGENLEEEKPKKIEEINISFTKDILPYILPLTCILTIKNTNTDFIKMLNDIKENPELLNTFDDQCLTWWNRKDLLDFIKELACKHSNKSSNMHNISIQFKTSLQSLIDNPKELLELIDNCLKPKEIEKKENGEVFTPMKIIDEMLDKMPVDVWKDKNLKWLDPAAGMGNFPVAVYLRLMETLKDEIKDEKERKKHILENMLYMCELNKKNIFICRQIFDINSEYTLNLYEGNTLEFDPYKTFGIRQFDIVLGNPPYNKGGIRSCTGKMLSEKNETIWTKFIEKAFEWLKLDGYLVFINPLSWLRKSHSLHNVMLEKYIIWMKLWNNTYSKMMINATIPISLYVLQNTINHDKKKTEIVSLSKKYNFIIEANEYLDSQYSIPLAYHNIFSKLIHFIEKNDCSLEYKNKTVKSSGNKTKLPKKYSVKDNLAIDTYTIKDGIMVKKALDIHPDINKRKLIIANKCSFNGAFIDDGKLSLTGNHKFYIMGNNLELIKKILQFKIMNVVCNHTKYGQDFLDNDAFTYIPDIRKLGIEDISEENFYELIGLTDDEIKTFDKTTTAEIEEHKD